jgi:hypothetical protein
MSVGGATNLSKKNYSQVYSIFYNKNTRAYKNEQKEKAYS